MNGQPNLIAEEAAAWHAASLDDAMDWDGFTAWLEADTRHRAVYDEIAMADALALEHAAPAIAAAAANDDEQLAAAPRNWMRWGGAAIAASLVALLVAPQLMTPAAQVYATGESARDIALDDGSRIVIAPHSRLEVGGRRQDRLELAGGAWFEIAHDPSRTMEIRAGDTVIGDIGTSFDVQAEAGHVRVEVADGAVSVSSESLSAPVRLASGHALDFDSGRGASIVTPLAAGDAGEWRHGRLTYTSAPLALVAADLSRYAGVRVTVPELLGQRQFSGTLAASNGEAALRDLSQLMGLELRHSGGDFSLSD